MRLLLLLIAVAALARFSHAGSASRQHFEKYDGLRLSRSKIERARRRWTDRNRRSRRTKLGTTQQSTSGSRFTHSLKDESLSNWFWSPHPVEFNHVEAAVGFTDPFLKRGEAMKDDLAVVIPVSIVHKSSRTSENLPTATAGSGMRKPLFSEEYQTTGQIDENKAENGKEHEWWPPCPQQHESNGWRKRRHRQTVGWGMDVYQSVRDAALHWEFAQGPQGIKRITPRPLERAHPKFQGRNYAAYQIEDDYQDPFNPELPNSVLAVGLNDRRGGGGISENLHHQRLATYTRMLRGLVTCINPVAIIYSHVDQCVAPTASHSNSNHRQNDIVTTTAYATCAQHWLCGEERVSVIFRPDTETVDVEILSLSRKVNSMWGRMVWPVIGPLQQRFFRAHLKALEQCAANAADKRNSAALESL